jgi:transcriptional regulator with XRE-family HTH domain
MTTETPTPWATSPSRSTPHLTLDQWIVRNGLTQHRASVLLGVLQQNLSKIRRGEQTPRAEIAARIVYGTQRLHDAGATRGVVPLWQLLDSTERAAIFGAKGRP